MGPKFRQSGLWLLGYDGQGKGYSSEEKLTYQKHSLIDDLPMLKAEVLQKYLLCN